MKYNVILLSISIMCLFSQAQDYGLDNDFNRACSLIKEGNLEQALLAFENLLILYPKTLPILYNAAYLYRHLGHHLEAVNLYKKILNLQPDYVRAHIGIAQAYLTLGEYKKGWRELEWRFGHPLESTERLKQYLEHHQRLDGKVILIRSEWGLGDSIMFIRYTQLLKDRGATVVVELQDPLGKLFKHIPWIDSLILPSDPLIPFHFEIPMVSLPTLFNTTLTTIPTPIPYLDADTTLTEQWKHTVDKKQFCIGICWQGNTIHASNKCMPLKQFIKLAQIPYVQLYSLQKHHGLKQYETIPDDTLITFEHLDINSGAFMDTAAIMKHLDLVITVDTSIAHLAGALGVPVWVILPKHADWRWMVERSDSPWYPTMRLFRQKHIGNWDETIKELSQQIHLHIQNKSQEAFKQAEQCYKQKDTDASYQHYHNAAHLLSFLLEAHPDHTALKKQYVWSLLQCNAYNLTRYLQEHNNLNNMTICLLAGWGLGDTLHFVRYAKKLKNLGATVICKPQQPLSPLMSTCPYIDTVIQTLDDAKSADFMISLIRLPDILSKTHEYKHVEFPYLQPNPQLCNYWKQQLAHDTTFKIGICWAGEQSNDPDRFIPLHYLEQLAELPGITLYSLQKKDGLEQLNNNGTIVQFTNFDTKHGAFMDTAAIMMNLDLIITIDTSIAHLAGALERPFWVLLHHNAWMPGAYPTRRWFQQPTPGSWQAVIDQVKKSVTALIQERQ